MATVRAVPVPYATIQAAHDAADAGDTILIEPGDYAAISITKQVHIKGNTDDPVNNPVHVGGIRSYLYFTGCGADRWVEGVTLSNDPNASAIVIFNGTYSSSEKIYFHRCTFKTGSNRLMYGSSSTPHIVCTNCYLNTSLRVCDSFDAGATCVFLACDGDSATLPYGSSVPADFFLGVDFLIQGTEDYGNEYGGWFYPTFEPQIYTIAGSVTLDGELDTVEVKLYRATDTGAESCAWITTYPDAGSGAWRFDYLPITHQYYVSLIPPVGYKPELLGPYVPLQE